METNFAKTYLIYVFFCWRH